MGGEEGAVVATQCADPELDDSSESAAQVGGIGRSCDTSRRMTMRRTRGCSA